MSEAGLRSEEYCEKKLRQERHGRCFVRIGILGSAGPGHVKENKSVGLGKEQRGKRCVTAMGGGSGKQKASTQVLRSARWEGQTGSPSHWSRAARNRGIRKWGWGWIRVRIKSGRLRKRRASEAIRD